MTGIPGFSSGGSMAIDGSAKGESGDIYDYGQVGGGVFGAPVYIYGDGNRATPAAAQDWQQYLPVVLMFLVGFVLIKAVK